MTNRATPVLLLLIASALVACTSPDSDSRQDENQSPPEPGSDASVDVDGGLADAKEAGPDVYVPADGKKLVATIRTSKGDIVVELNHTAAPVTVDNFKKYADARYYDGLIFHRVIKGFMIQGGGFEPGMAARKTLYPAIVNEAKTSGLSNVKGTLAMARTSKPNSATSQFFINTVDNAKDLDPSDKNPYGYAVLGAVSQGMDVVLAIESVATTTIAGYEDVPSDSVLINSLVVEEVSK